MSLTILDCWFYDIDQKCQKNQCSKINGFHDMGVYFLGAKIGKNLKIQYLWLQLADLSQIYIQIYVFDMANSF